MSARDAGGATWWSNALRSLPRWYERITREALAPAEAALLEALLAEHRARPLQRVLIDPVGPGRLARCVHERLRTTEPLHLSDDSDHLLLALEDALRARADAAPVRSAPRRAGVPPFDGDFDRIVAAFAFHETFARGPVLEELVRDLDRREAQLAPGGELWWVHLLGDAAVPDAAIARHLQRLGAQATPSLLGRLGRALVRSRLGTDAVRRERRRLPGRALLEDAVRESRFGTARSEAMLPVVLDGQEYADGVLWMRLRKAEVISRGQGSEPLP